MSTLMDITLAQRHLIEHICAGITNAPLHPLSNNYIDPVVPTVTPRGPVPSGRDKPKTGTWNNHSLKLAIAAMEAGRRVKTVACYFDILPSSLADHLHGRILG